MLFQYLILCTHMDMELQSRSTPLLAVRVRPTHAIGRATAAGASVITSADDSHVAVKSAGREFPVDVQLWGSDQEQAWRTLGEPLVHTVLSGVSATLLTHGCAGSGKTYTLSGQGMDAPGLVPRCLRALTDAASQRDSGLQLEMCMIEVYMDRAYDLLAPRSADHPRVPLHLSAPRSKTTVWWTAADDASATGSVADSALPTGDCWHAVSTAAQAEALRQLGEAQRTVRPTALHERVGRGHVLLFVRLTQTRTQMRVAHGDPDARPSGAADTGGVDDGAGDGDDVSEGGSSEGGGGGVPAEVEWQSHLCLATLCGSERVEANGTLSAPALRESLNLSASLSALGGLLPLLARRDAPSRTASQRVVWGTPLVQLLRETLEGHAALIVLACVSPSPRLAAESLSTLRFLTATRPLPLAPVRRVSAVRIAIVGAVEQVRTLRNLAAASESAATSMDDANTADLAPPKPHIRGQTAHKLSILEATLHEAHGKLTEVAKLAESASQHNAPAGTSVDGSTAIGRPLSAEDDKALVEAMSELKILRALLTLEVRERREKERHTSLRVRRSAMGVRHHGLPTAMLLSAFGWSTDLSQMHWHADEADEYVADGAGGLPPTTASAQDFLHTAHLLDLPAAACGGPTLRLPLPLPGHRTWIRGAAGTSTAAGPLGMPSSAAHASAPPTFNAASSIDTRMFAGDDESDAEASLRVFGMGVGGHHAALAVSADGSVQIELLSDEHTCVLNGDLLTCGHAFTLHHGDRLFVGTERLFLVSLWRPLHDPLHAGRYIGVDPLHDGTHEAAAADAAAHGHGSVVIGADAAPVGGWSASPIVTDLTVGGVRHGGGAHRGGFGDVGGGGSGGGGSLAFRLEAESLLRRAEVELHDATGIRFHELHRLRRAGQVLRSTWRRAVQSLFTPDDVVAAELGVHGSTAGGHHGSVTPTVLTRMATADEVAAAVRSTEKPLEPIGPPLWRPAGGRSPTAGESGATGEADDGSSPTHHASLEETLANIQNYARLTPMTKPLASPQVRACISP